MVRECRPPAREPGRSWLARRSTIATSTPANANSPANINPVGPAPTIRTPASRMVIKHSRRSQWRASRVLTEEMSTRVFLTGSHKAANRGFAILEVIWFGPTSILVDRLDEANHFKPGALGPIAPSPALAQGPRI